MLKELEYPFDTGYILSKKKKIKKILLDNSQKFLEKRIAILGGSTVHDITLVLELFLLNYGIKPVFYESEYCKYYEDAMFSNPALEEFKPDIIYIFTTNKNVTQYPKISDTKEKIEELLNNEKNKFESMWQILNKKYNCPIIQNNFEMPFYRLLGNKDASDIHGKTNFLSKLNMMFYEYAQNNTNFYICDINYISADYGLKEWSNPFYYYMYKYCLNVNAIPYLSFNVANIIKSIFGKNKKGFVLDLDNTLWGGIIGDDGVENINLGHEKAEGEAYLDFQNYLKEHKQLGLILNINSKNDYENAILGLNHPDSILSADDFIDIEANWEPKDKNFLKIANNLSLLPESLVFIDDNPAERNLVSMNVSGVVSPEIDTVHNYIQIIDRNGFFESATLSADDENRNQMYKENMQRMEMQSKFEDYETYLKFLSMEATVNRFEKMYYPRILQLINKSNQFNLTTKRYTQSEIEKLADDSSHITIYIKLKDKYGDNGLISCVIGSIEKGVCNIDLWVMSCRVLKRNVEYLMLDSIVKKCQERNISKIIGYYYPTSKNKMVENLYSMLGFSQFKKYEDGSSEWIFEIPQNYKNKNEIISINGD